MRKIALMLCLASFLTISAAAQTGTTTTTTDRGTGEAYLGFAHTTGDIGKNGWNVSAAKFFGRYFAVEGDFAGQYGNTSILDIKVRQHDYSFLAGGKVAFDTHNEKWTPWAHLLLGVANTGLDSNVAGANNGDTSFAWELGGGVDYHLTTNVAARGKADIYHTSYFNTGDSHARYGFGIVYTFGK